MNYYEIIPASGKYHGDGGLTYSSDQLLETGQIVNASMRGVLVSGFVSQRCDKPSFPVQPINRVFEGLILPKTSLDLFSWISEYYPGPFGALASQFLPANLSSSSKESFPASTLQIDKPTVPALTTEQQETIKFIDEQKLGSFLIHGETGSGKTRVYIELAQKALASGKSVLVLTPEIALTPQLVDKFTEVFGSLVNLTHSQLTPLQRKLLWIEMLQTTDPKIIIGPRSALFMPLKNLGLIIIDEFHDQAYKQENTPYYQSLRVASKLASVHSAKLVLGSATPSINEYYIALAKQIPILRMVAKPALKKGVQSDITTFVADLSDTAEKTKYPLISTTLLRELNSCLTRGEQAMVFLNKRGSARSIICQSCSWKALCPRCDLALVYHGDTHSLSCHTCGYSGHAPTTCPTCGSSQILFKSPGTKAVADSLKSLFPQARIARFDKDNKKSERIEAQHASIKDGSIDILVGTQLLTKGHDLPNLSLVAILMAETGLIFPDYTAEEQSYQIIHQLLGRVGRGHRPGFAVVQTFDPKNITIQAAMNGKWEDFYNVQVAERKAFGFPPFFHVMKIHAIRRSRLSAKSAAEKIASDIKKSYPAVNVVGPSPSFIEKRSDKWYWQLIVKSKNRATLVDIAKSLPGNIPVDIDPSQLL